MTTERFQEASFAEVLSFVDGITGERQRSLVWLQSPLTQFGGKTPEELISMGRACDVLGYLQSISSGFVG